MGEPTYAKATMGEGRVELPCLTAHDFESCVSAIPPLALFYVDVAIILGYSKDINKWPE